MNFSVLCKKLRDIENKKKVYLIFQVDILAATIILYDRLEQDFFTQGSH